ncbi:MAG: hypothetical protein RIQ55_394 [Pseudomonadota bacterium]|jgi:hypothetical protein
MATTIQDSTGSELYESIIITKTERHQVDFFYEFELDANKLAEIYPEYDEDHLAQLMADLRTGVIPVEAIIADASDANVDIAWESDGQKVLSLKNGDFEKTYGINDE